MKPHCCPCGESHGPNGSSFTRPDFLKGARVAALGSVAAGSLAGPLLAAGTTTAEAVWRPAPLTVKPILVHSVPTRRPQTSWRNWGGIETEADARAEVARIEGGNARIWIERLGRFGTAARGVVFTLIGVFLLQAAVKHNASRAQGIDGVLTA